MSGFHNAPAASSFFFDARITPVTQASDARRPNLARFMPSAVRQSVSAH